MFPNWQFNCITHCPIQLKIQSILYLYPLSQWCTVVPLEGGHDLYHVRLATRDNDTNHGWVIGTQAFHGLLQLLGEISRFLFDTSHWNINDELIQYRVPQAPKICHVEWAYLREQCATKATALKPDVDAGIRTVAGCFLNCDIINYGGSLASTVVHINSLWTVWNWKSYWFPSSFLHNFPFN